MSEQFVGQELAAARPPWEPRDLFCWARECRSSNAEVDYLGASGGRIYPVEVKSGATGRLKSMHQFLAEKGTDFGLRFNGDAPSFVKTEFPDGAGARRPFRLLSLPLYLASEARRLVARSAFFAALALSLGVSPSVRAARTFDSSAKTSCGGTRGTSRSWFSADEADFPSIIRARNSVPESARAAAGGLHEAIEYFRPDPLLFH